MALPDEACESDAGSRDNLPSPQSTNGAKQGKRSKSGCGTCRLKKVKCNEQRPECARCYRLGLACQWPGPRLSLRERRRERGISAVGHRNLQACAVPEGMTQRGSPASPRASTTLVTPSTPPDETLGDALQYQTRATEAVAIHPSSSRSRIRPGSTTDIIDNTIQVFGDAPLQVDASFLPISQSLLPSWEQFCAPWSSLADSDHDFQVAAVPRPLMPGDFIGQPVMCSIALTPLDCRGLDHYSTTFTAAFTPKNPKWSTPSMLRSISLGDHMLMHLLLAVALNDLWYRGRQSDGELHAAAQQHYDCGENLFAERRNVLSESGTDPGTDAPTHLHICAAFWFMYMYQTRTPDVDVAYLRQLSIAVADHVRTYRLDELCASGTLAPSQDTEACDGAPSAQLLTSAILSAPNGALIASMIICLYYEDIKYGFYHCGGRLATHLNSNKMRLGRIYDLGRSALALHWGADYPINEFVDDLESYTNLKFQSELHILLEDLNCEFSYSRRDEEAEKRFRGELEKLAASYPNVLEMESESFPERGAGGNQTARIRKQTYGSVSVAYFHAIRIYIFRCAVEPASADTPPDIQTALSTVLKIARRVHRVGSSSSNDSSSYSARDEQEIFHRLEWPLFIAGVESKDVFYQDWIIWKMQKTSIKKALERVIEEQTRTGKRAGVDCMRQAFLQQPLGR